MVLHYSIDLDWGFMDRCPDFQFVVGIGIGTETILVIIFIHCRAAV